MRLTSKQSLFKDLNINRWTLFFKDPTIEKQFREEYFLKSIHGFRISFIIATLLYALLGFLDYYTSNPFYKEFFIVRYVVVAPLLTGVWLTSFHPKFKNHWQILITFCFIVGGSGILFMLLKNPVNIFYYGGIFLIFMAGYFLIKLHYVWATTTGVLLVFFYNLGALYFNSLEQINHQHLLITNTFFISANIISILALYNNKLLERVEFNNRLLLSKQKEEIKRINAHLESKVKERTQSLEKQNKALNEEINRRKKIEKKLTLAKYDAEESDRLKSAFLANMSHEIRTPMNGIIGFLDLISAPDVTKDEKEMYYDIMRQSGNRLLQTINDIVEFSKIEAGELVENVSEVELGKMFKYISEFFSHNLTAKNITLKMPFDASLIRLKTDENKLESILINLVNNALKFTKKGFIEIGVNPGKTKLNFYVKDTGIGIPKDRQNAIFDRFVQADLSLTRGHEGSGLGLSICKAYIEVLGGEIWVESEENHGTTFYFTIDYIPVTQTNIAPSKTKPMNKITKTQTHHTILIAEDDEVSYNLLYTILQSEQIELIWAKNGKEAIEFFQNTPSVSLIIMDIKMPIIDGIKATQEIRKTNRNIPIIAQTAFALSGDREIALEAGCNDYLSKPLKRNDLVKTIEKYLQPKQKLF